MSEKSSTSNPFDDLTMAQEYEDWYSTIGRRADHLEKALLESLFSKFPKAHSVLEVGCGTGHFTRWFEAHGLRAIGLDISLPMLCEARRYEPSEYLRADAHHLPFAACTFDIVTLITTLEFLQDPVHALQEAHRVARRGLILGVINSKSWIGRKYRRRGSPPWEHAYFFTPGELVQMVRQITGKDSEPFWRTTLWRFWPWALPLPWGGFIGMRVRIE